ncbi:hypothetical protein ACLKA6_011935 [Drosophila palustris]
MRTDKVERLVYAACILHNFLKAHESNYIEGIDKEDVDEVSFKPGEWHFTQPLTGLPAVDDRSAEQPRLVRDQFIAYFNTTGAVSWQTDAIKKFNF